MIVIKTERCRYEETREYLKLYPDLLLVAERQDHDVGKAHGIDRDAICVVIASVAFLPAMRSQEDRRCVAGNEDRKLELCIAIFVASPSQLSMSHDVVDLSRSENRVREVIESGSYATSHCTATPVNTRALAVLLREVALFRLRLLERTTDLQGDTPCFVQGARVA